MYHVYMNRYKHDLCSRLQKLIQNVFDTKWLDI